MRTFATVLKKLFGMMYNFLAVTLFVHPVMIHGTWAVILLTKMFLTGLHLGVNRAISFEH